VAFVALGVSQVVPLFGWVYVCRRATRRIDTPGCIRGEQVVPDFLPLICKTKGECIESRRITRKVELRDIVVPIGCLRPSGPEDRCQHSRVV
jgi:hypothetical protein